MFAVLLTGLLDTIYFTSRDIRYLAQYLRLLTSILNIKETYGDICQFIRDTCLFTSRDMGYLVPHKKVRSGKDQESIQLSTTPDSGYNMGKVTKAQLNITNQSK